MGALVSGTSASAQHNNGEGRKATDAIAASRPPQPVTGVPAWGIESPDLKPDSTIVYGVLANGMRYAIKPHVRGSGEISMRLMLDVGALSEADGEEGAAHFVEHMAFNGSTNIPEGTLVPTLERLGLAFGPDTNAETAMEYTVYKLELPSARAEVVDTSLRILRDIAGELTFPLSSVDREKGIMRSEAQLRNTPPARRSTEFFRSAFANPRIGERTGATPAQLSALDAGKLRAFYDAYYRPERATLVVVGDMNPTRMEEKIAALFGDWQGKGAARATYDASVPARTSLATGTFFDPTVPEIVEMQRVIPYAPPANTVAGFRDELLDYVVATSLSNRINVYAKQENTFSLGGSAASWDYFKAARTYGFVLLAKDGEWRRALDLGEQEWRRLYEHGITESELAEAKRILATEYAALAKQAPSMNIGDLAQEIALSSLNGSVYLSPARKLELYKSLEPGLTVDALARRVRERWEAAPNYVMVASKTPLASPSTAIPAAMEQSRKVAVAAPAELADVAFAYTDFGKPGKVVSDKFIADLGIRAITFDNGFMLNLMRTRYEPGTVSYRLELGGGSSAFTQGLPGLALMTQVVSPIDGLGAHDIDELRRIMAGQKLGYGFIVEQDAVVLEGNTTRDNADFQLGLLAAEVSDKAFGPQTERQWDGYAPVIATDIAASPMDLYFNALDSLLTDGDTRLGFTDPAVLTQRTVAELKSALGAQLGGGQMELALVGDFDEEAMIAAAARTLGAMDRTATRANVAPMAFSADRRARTLYHRGAPDQGVVSLSWPTGDASDLRTSLALELLAKLMELRSVEKLREELGATYSPFAFAADSLAFKGYGHLTVLASAEPKNMVPLAAAMRELAQEFVDEAPTADAMLRARLPILEGYERQEGTNMGWTFIVSDTQSNPDILDRRRTRAALLRAITPQDIQKAARGYFGESPIEIRVVPQDGAGSTAPAR
ncbi:insulinase family protein [Parerythrobacter aurantius]|uniref:M16 family metallopeptidase n=1 Tax=Parerythrobacter aurantius TaxID=3127706 RepID=UPI0032520B8C